MYGCACAIYLPRHRILSWVAAAGVLLAWNQFSNRDNGQVVDKDAQAKWNERIVAADKQQKLPPAQGK